ncbi:MAG: hypothetical protein JXA03_02505 [Bacteroidales bacterium]|nr:hypothetical protein [Bacteroidales bacterium]
MEKATRYAVFLVTMALFFVSQHLYADEPPNPGGGPGSGDLPVGGASPIGGGLLFLAVLASAYLGKKLITQRKDAGK